MANKKGRTSKEQRKIHTKFLQPLLFHCSKGTWFASISKQVSEDSQGRLCSIDGQIASEKFIPFNRRFSPSHEDYSEVVSSKDINTHPVYSKIRKHLVKNWKDSETWYEWACEWEHRESELFERLGFATTEGNRTTIEMDEVADFFSVQNYSYYTILPLIAYTMFDDSLIEKFFEMEGISVVYHMTISFKIEGKWYNSSNSFAWKALHPTHFEGFVKHPRKDKNTAGNQIEWHKPERKSIRTISGGAPGLGKRK